MTFDSVPHYSFSGTPDPIKSQVILHEGSNVIEIQTDTMPSGGGDHTMGLENSSGNSGVPYPGRNSSDWSIGQEGVRFIPLGSLVWHRNSVTGPVVDTGEHVTVDPASADDFYAVVQGPSGGAYIDSVSVELYTEAIADFEDTITNGNIVEFNSNSLNASSWSWDFGDGTFASGSPDVTHIFSSTGTFQTTLVIETAEGCKDTATSSITIESFVGLESKELDNVETSLRPNPVSRSQARFRYSLKEDAEVQVRLFNARGQLVRTLQASEQQDAGTYQLQMGASDFAEAGTYFIRMNVDGETFTKRLVVDR